MIKFPEGFYWGAALSGPQTEGITNKANESVWDAWYKEEPDRFFNNWSAETACDTYNKYKEDCRMMKDISLNSIRTSIQWSRLIKNLETGEVDPDAVRFYNDYIDEMISNDVVPFINLYHFDMPNELMVKYGGFESKHVVELFAKFAKSAFELFGDRVKYWITFNEPIVPIEFGYYYDAHKPNKVDPKLGVQAGYNTILAHAKAVEEYRKLGLSGEIGTVLNLTPAYPRSSHKADLKASEYCDAIFNKSFLDPIVKGEFNPLFTEICKENDMLPDMTQEEVECIFGAKIDFIGLNYYVPRRVCAPLHAPNTESPWMPDWYFDNYSMPGSRNNPHRANNEIYPKAVYDMAMDLKENYGNIRWYLAEIGISITDEQKLVEDGVINDTFRTELLKEHLVYLHKAIEDGSNCFGVHQWTFIDNWSWLNSYCRRYGFYSLNVETGERTMKKHALWFKELIKNNGF